MDRRTRRALLWASASLTLLVAAPAAAQTADQGKPDFDSRERVATRPAGPESPAGVRARDRLSARLGRQGVLDVDAHTGTPRFVGRLDGFLTGPSQADPAQIVLDYVRSQRAVFGLSEDDLAALRLTQRRTDQQGTTYLIWAQTWRGLTAWDNELRAAVAADGRLVNVGGSPVPGLSTRTAQPSLPPAQALAKALADVDARGLSPRATARGGPERRTDFSGGHDAHLVLFTERAGDVHLAWRVTDVAGPLEVYEHLIDAHSGRVLLRSNQVHTAAGSTNSFRYSPIAAGDAPSSQPVPVDDETALQGPFAHVYPDEDDDNAPDAEIAASSTGPPPAWTDAFTDVCGGPAVCSWDDFTDDSWRPSIRQNAAQVYFFLNVFATWLAGPDVGFTAATGGFDGGDAVRGEVFDGAASAGGGPDIDHKDNASMFTPPDGSPPRMQMFLFDDPDVNGGDDASVVYHEYAHGLSTRSVIRADGTAALDSHQSGSMGEGWSDWYAMDKLVADTLQPDTAAPGEVVVGRYASGRATGVRTEALDCPVGQTSANCAASGYTFGDLAGIDPGGPEVHADGEIWGQTLWDLRDAVGGATARRLITGAMRLSPPDPSMLDMRNAILQADQVTHSGANRTAIWQVFAKRGMGFFAASFGGDHINPVENFDTEPAPGSGGPVSGTVTEGATGRPVQGALVELASRASGFPGDLIGTTDANGNYSIADVPGGTYPLVLVDAPGHTPSFEPDVTVGPGGRRLDALLRRDWMSASGGGAITAFDQPDFAPQCGPGGLIDLSFSTGWGSSSHNARFDPAGPKSVTVALPQAVDVDVFALDPGAVCGDDDTAGVGKFRIETSPDGVRFTQAAVGTTTGVSDPANLFVPTAGAEGVRFVRYTMLEPRRQGPGDDGRDFMDTTELELFGVPAGFRPKPFTPDPGTVQPPVTLPPVDRSGPVARLASAARQRLATALSKGLKVTVECNEPCSASLTATLDAKTAKKVKLLSRRSRAKTVKVASGTLRTGPGKRTATLKFTRKAKKLLKRQKRLKLALSAALADASGNKASGKLRVVLKR